MNKKLLGIVLAVTLVAPSLSFAATNSYAGVPNSILQQLLTLLVQEVAQLEQQLAQQQAQINTITATSTVATTTATSSPIVQQLQTLQQSIPTTTPSRRTAPVITTNNNSLGDVPPVVTPDVTLTPNETLWMNEYVNWPAYQQVRTDDPVNCPQPTYATTTANMAWIDTLNNGSPVSTFNGLDINPLFANPNFGGYNVTPGEQVTLTGDFRAEYCINYQQQENGNVLPPLTSTTTYTFTVPSREFAGDLFYTIGGRYNVVSSTASTTQ